MSARPLSDLANMCKNGLPTGWSIYRRKEDGAVIVRQPLVKPTPKEVGREPTGPDYSEVRVDSIQDRDLAAKGEVPWFEKILRESSKGGSK